MIETERLGTFLDALDHGNTEFLEQLYKEAREKDIPVIRRQMQQFLKPLLLLTKPKSVLEIGAAIGFSSILMAEYTAEDCRITTIENYEKRIPMAVENIKRSGYEDRITLLKGDAAKILPSLTGPYDLIFMDAAKGQYIHFLPEVKRLLKDGGVLLSDNVLQNGEVILPRTMVERRDRTIHKRMRDYLFALKNDPELETSILPLGDGVTFSVRKKNEK